MNILKCFSNYELDLLKSINLFIEDKKYNKLELEELSKSIYNKGYLKSNITYSEAEKYRQMHERIKTLPKIDLDKVTKYSATEFKEDYYLCTILMHGAIYNNPKRINKVRENQGKKLLSEVEEEKYKRSFEENSKRLLDYTQKLEEKYGGELSIVEEYYNTISE